MRLSPWTLSLHRPRKEDLLINVEALGIIGAGKYSPEVCSKGMSVNLCHISGAGKPSSCCRQCWDCPAGLDGGTAHSLSDVPSVPSSS